VANAGQASGEEQFQIPPEWQKALDDEKKVQQLCDELRWMDAIDLLLESYKTRYDMLHKIAPKVSMTEEQKAMVSAPLIQPMLQLGSLYRMVGQLKVPITSYPSCKMNIICLLSSS